MRQAMMSLLENMGPVREATLGYKAALVADGFNEHIAERMAVDFHGYLTHVLRSQIAPPK